VNILISSWKFIRSFIKWVNISNIMSGLKFVKNNFKERPRTYLYISSFILFCIFSFVTEDWHDLIPNIATTFFDIFLTVLVVDTILQLQSKREKIERFRGYIANNLLHIILNVGQAIFDLVTNQSKIHREDNSIHFWLSNKEDIVPFYTRTFEHLRSAWIDNTESMYERIDTITKKNEKEINEFLTTYITILPDEVTDALSNIIAGLLHFNMISEFMYKLVNLNKWTTDDFPTPNQIPKNHGFNFVEDESNDSNNDNDPSDKEAFYQFLLQQTFCILLIVICMTNLRNIADDHKEIIEMNFSKIKL
jgi:hypothetical protein